MKSNINIKFIKKHILNESSPLLSKKYSNESPLEKILRFIESGNELLSMKFYSAIACYSAPIILNYVLQSSLMASNIWFLSQKGKDALTLGTLCNTFATLTGWCIALGMSTSLDTLLTRSFTDIKSRSLMSLYLQRNIVVSLLFFIPVIMTWWNSKVLFVKFGMEKSSQEAQNYMRMLCICVVPYIGFESLKKFLMAQGYVSAPMKILSLAMVFNISLIYIFLNYSPLNGITLEAPLILCLTYWMMLLLSIFYIKFINGYQCWSGLSKKAFSEWGEILKLGVPGILMISCDFFAFEIMLLASTRINNTSVAVHSIMVSISNLNYMAFHGLSISGSTLLGNLLGKKYYTALRKVRFILLIGGAFVSFINSGLLLFFTNYIAEFYSQDTNVLTALKALLPLVALNILFDSLATLNLGMLRGLGKQAYGAVINLGSFYLLGIPSGFYLAFNAGFGLAGLWLGLIIALATVAITLSIGVLFEKKTKKTEGSLTV